MLREKLEQAVFILIAIISIAISVLDLFGLLGSLPWIADRLVSINLLVLGTIAGYLVLERRSKLEKIETLLEDGLVQIVNSLEGVSVRRLNNSLQYWQYMYKQIEGAEKSIDDLTWGLVKTTRKTEVEDKAFKNYLDGISSVCRRKKGLRYREVMTFPTISRVERASVMISKNLKNYQLKYYDVPHRKIPPLIQFTIIDGEEIIFGTYRGVFLPTEGEIYLAVKHPLLARLFQDYFDAIWQGANVLKDGDKIDGEILARMRKSLS